MKNSGSLFISIIAAATAGVIIGMLIAPEKGEAFRKTIKDAAGDWTKKLSDLLAEGKEQVKSLGISFGNELNELENGGKGNKV
jgi:gas vesicle protein